MLPRAVWQSFGRSDRNAPPKLAGRCCSPWLAANGAGLPGDAPVRWPKRHRFGPVLDVAVPDHDAITRISIGAEVALWRGRAPPKLSITSICPPQQGHAARRSVGEAGFFVTDGRAGGEQVPGAGDVGLAVARGEQAVVANAMEALGLGVHEEAPDELVGGQRHGAVAGVAVTAVVLVTERDAGLVERDQAPVRDGDAVRVARQVGQHGLGATEGRLGVDDPCVRASSGEENVDVT